MTLNRRLATAAAIAVAAAVCGFSLSMTVGDENASYAASLTLAWAYVVLAGGFSAAAASDRSVAAKAGAAFATLYAGFATAVYFVQLTTVLHRTAPADILQVLSYQELGSVMFTLELLGYALMALSTLFIGLTISTATRVGRWLRWMPLAHGVFAPVCLALPIVNVFGSMPRASGAVIGVAISFGWCAYFLPVALLAFAYLRSARPSARPPVRPATWASASEVKERNSMHLPAAVHDLAVRLGVTSQSDPQTVALTQKGRMKPNLRSRTWLGFTASQTISTRACDFDWRANAGPFGLISGRDALLGGEGQFDIVALGFIPIVRAQSTPALVRGELMRYLAEIVWVPHAIIHNTDLRWGVIDA